MKKIYILLMSVAAVLPAMADSLLKNGGFEESGSSEIVKSWKAADWSPRHSPVQLTIDRAGAPEGDCFVRVISEPLNGNVVVMQDIRNPEPGHYSLSLKCRPEQGCEAYASAVGIQSGKNVVYENTPKVKEADQWTDQSLEFDLPKNIEILRIVLRTNSKASFDAVNLVFQDFSPGQEPSTAAAVTQSRVEADYSLAFDRERKEKMSADERAWEQVLEENLGSFYLPIYKRDKEKGKETAWDYVQDVPGLPRVLLIGDSISRGYTLAVRHALEGKANVHRAPANCSSTSQGLNNLDVWLGSGHWDLIHFNFGIHDRKSSPEDYGQRLEQIVQRLQKTGARLIFATSTPMPKDSPTYAYGACVPLNEKALQIMAQYKIPVNDLYTAIKPRQDELQRPSDCHFNDEGYSFLGQKTAEAILQQLNRTE